MNLLARTARNLQPPPRSVEPPAPAALRAYLQILRDAPTLEDATAFAEAHPLRSLTPTVADPVPWASEGSRPLRIWVMTPTSTVRWQAGRRLLSWLREMWEAGR